MSAAQSVPEEDEPTESYERVYVPHPVKAHQLMGATLMSLETKKNRGYVSIGSKILCYPIDKIYVTITLDDAIDLITNEEPTCQN